MPGKYRSSPLLILISLMLMIFALCQNADTPDAYSIGQIIDVVVGFVIAVSFSLWLGIDPQNHLPRIRWGTIVLIILTWVMISGSLLWWHYALMRIRWASDHMITANHMKQIHLALEAYAKDCGTFPTEEQGLMALIVNPGIAKWAGPYNELQVESLSDSWGNPIQYQIHKNEITVSVHLSGSKLGELLPAR